MTEDSETKWQMCYSIQLIMDMLHYPIYKKEKEIDSYSYTNYLSG